MQPDAAVSGLLSQVPEYVQMDHGAFPLVGGEEGGGAGQEGDAGDALFIGQDLNVGQVSTPTSSTNRPPWP